MRAPPLQDPLSYPGASAPWSFRLHGDVATRFDGPLPDRRTAVLGVGSNACPAQLAAKFRAGMCSGDLVGVVVSVARLQVRPSAHLSRSGYWPFAPMASSGTARAVLCLLDDDQLDVLDRTEPNYDRRKLDARTHPVAGVPDELCAEGAWVYVSKHGVVDDPRLPAWSDPPPSQVMLLDALMELVPVSPQPSGAVGLSAALRRDPELAGELTSRVKQYVTVRSSGLTFIGSGGS